MMIALMAVYLVLLFLLVRFGIVTFNLFWKCSPLIVLLLLMFGLFCCCTPIGGETPRMELHPFRQRTLKRRAELRGVGLHSGAEVAITLASAPADTGIVFVRDGEEIPALADFVVDTETTLLTICPYSAIASSAQRGVMPPTTFGIE